MSEFLKYTAQGHRFSIDFVQNSKRIFHREKCKKAFSKKKAAKISS